MPKFVIEREMPGAGSLNAEQLKGASAQSNSAVSEMGSRIEWVQSFVTGDKVYCVYNADSEADIREHAEKSGFPVNVISQIANIIGPTTAD